MWAALTFTLSLSPVWHPTLRLDAGIDDFVPLPRLELMLARSPALLVPIVLHLDPSPNILPPDHSL